MRKLSALPAQSPSQLMRNIIKLFCCAFHLLTSKCSYIWGKKEDNKMAHSIDFYEDNLYLQNRACQLNCYHWLLRTGLSEPTQATTLLVNMQLLLGLQTGCTFDNDTVTSTCLRVTKLKNRYSVSKDPVTKTCFHYYIYT